MEKWEKEFDALPIIIDCNDTIPNDVCHVNYPDCDKCMIQLDRSKLKSFISEVRKEAVREFIDRFNLVEPKSEDFGNVSKVQIFIAGQMNLMIRQKQALAEFEKEGK